MKICHKIIPQGTSILRLFALASHGINLEEFHEEQVYWSLLGIEFPKVPQGKKLPKFIKESIQRFSLWNRSLGSYFLGVSQGACFREFSKYIYFSEIPHVLLLKTSFEEFMQVP